jgi:hypothetical protein
MHQDIKTVLSMHVFDIDWMHNRLIAELKRKREAEKEIIR